MTEEQALALYREHCQPGDRGALERYGEKAAVAAIMVLSQRQSEVIAQYIAQRTANMTGTGGIVDSILHNQIEVLRAVADRLAGVREDAETQTVSYWSMSSGAWVPFQEDEE